MSALKPTNLDIEALVSWASLKKKHDPSFVMLLPVPACHGVFLACPKGIYHGLFIMPRNQGFNNHATRYKRLGAMPFTGLKIRVKLWIICWSMPMAFRRPKRHYRATEEDLIQIAYFDLVRAYKGKYEDLKMIYSIPNGLKLHPLTAQKAVDSGLTKGIWDINIDVPRGTYHGARIEVKTTKGYLTKDQKEYKIRYVNQGFLPVVCRSCDELWKFTLDYLGLMGLKNFYYGNYS